MESWNFIFFKSSANKYSSSSFKYVLEIDEMEKFPLFIIWYRCMRDSGTTRLKSVFCVGAIVSVLKDNGAGGLARFLLHLKTILIEISFGSWSIAGYKLNVDSSRIYTNLFPGRNDRSIVCSVPKETEEIFAIDFLLLTQLTCTMNPPSTRDTQT